LAHCRFVAGTWTELERPNTWLDSRT
jgi:hypothetical protein